MADEEGTRFDIYVRIAVKPGHGLARDELQREVFNKVCDTLKFDPLQTTPEKVEVMYISRKW